MSGIGPHPYQVSGLSVSSLISCSGARMGLAGEAAKPAARAKAMNNNAQP